MAKGNHQKLKLLYLAKILRDRTDADHGLSVQEIIEILEQHDISAERKSIYTDIQELNKFGLDIVSYRDGRTVKYQMLGRDFELAELKLLVDSVQASKFITERKSRELIKKLEKLASATEAKELQRQVILSGRIKTMNESIYYNVDAIHAAINANRQITFQYVQWNLSKKQEPRKNGTLYQVSPWALIWDNESYYMIGYDNESFTMKHYRVDKMKSINSVEKSRREGKKDFESLNLPKYSRSLFGMFGGDEVNVQLLCHNSMIGPILDRFGTDIPIIPVDDEHFRTTVSVIASNYFLGWIIGLGKNITVTGPDTVVQALKCEIHRLREQYNI